MAAYCSSDTSSRAVQDQGERKRKDDDEVLQQLAPSWMLSSKQEWLAAARQSRLATGGKSLAWMESRRCEDAERVEAALETAFLWGAFPLEAADEAAPLAPPALTIAQARCRYFDEKRAREKAAAEKEAAKKRVARRAATDKRAVRKAAADKKTAPEKLKAAAAELLQSCLPDLCGRALDSVRLCPSRGWVPASQPGSEDLPARREQRRASRSAHPLACTCLCPRANYCPWCSLCLRPISGRHLRAMWSQADLLGGPGAAQSIDIAGPRMLPCWLRVAERVCANCVPTVVGVRGVALSHI